MGQKLNSAVLKPVKWLFMPKLKPESDLIYLSHEIIKDQMGTDQETDPVNHPKHYTSNPSGVECIDVVEHMNFCRGNAIKYIWRAGNKGDEIEDLNKARWYIDREIERLIKDQRLE